ncbi:MAG: CHASE2 domain-containing protein, partial [Nitrospiria bacterium]
MISRVWSWERMAGMFWAGTVAAVYLLGGFERIELMSYDWRMRLFAAPPADRIVIVAIDNPSVKELSIWPWPRSLHTRMVETLVGAGAKAIAFDIDFSTSRDADDDARFARSVRRADRVVIPAFQDGRALETGVLVEYANLPYPALHHAARAVGSINIPIDPDGVIRRSPITSTILGETGWSFAVQVARVFLDVDRSPRPNDFHEGLGIGAARLGNGPVSYIRFFGGPSTFPSVSYADVVAGRVDPALFKGKIVLIGATSLELQDLRSTPFPGLMAGVEIQANTVETLLAGVGYRRTGRWEILTGMAGIVLLWTIVPMVVHLRPQRNRRRRAAAIGVAGGMVLGVIGVGAIWSFHALWFMDAIPLAATACGQVVTSLIAGYISAERRIEFQSENLQALYRMGEETRSVTSVDRLADLLLTQTRHLLAVDRLGVDLWDLTATPQRVFRDARGSH